MSEQGPLLPKKDADPEVLYHYTSFDGLLGILTDKTIWATHFRYLNDISEGQIVSQMAWNELNERVNTGPLFEVLGLPPSHDSLKRKCDDEDILSQGMSMLSWVTSLAVFVTSFSENGNLLSQWRAYTGNTGGVSIGFSPGYLQKLGAHFLQSQQERFYAEDQVLIECRYCNETEETRLKTWIDHLVTSFIEEAESLRDISQNEKLKGFHTPAAIALKHFLKLGFPAATTKNNAFREEAEWRLAFHSNPNRMSENIEFRVGRSMITPYFNVPLEWDKQPIEISEIIVGPCPHRTDAMNSIQMLLKKHGLKDVTVKDSGIPYRSW